MVTLSPQLNTNVAKYAAMEVAVTDGINEAKAVMQLVVRLITEDMLFNSVTVRLDDMTEEAFLSPLLNFFLDGLAAIIPCPKENIYIFSIQDDTDTSVRILNVSFSAKRPDIPHDGFYSPQYLQERVYLNRAILARLATVQVLPFDDNLCVREPCLNFEQCVTVLKFGNASGFIHSDTVLFRPIYPVNTFACKCPDGFTGSKEHYLCDTEIDLCYSNPCQNGGTCRRRESGYTCMCSARYAGEHCELIVDQLPACSPLDLCDLTNSCHTAATSSAAWQQPSPLTATCALRARSFTQNSFLTFESLHQRNRFNVQLRFATIQANGLLLYNGRYNELHDFIALEIRNGEVNFSFSLGDSIGSVAVRRPVSDGRWHDVEVDYFNRSVMLSVDACDTALASSNLGPRWSCANRTTFVLDRRCSSLTESCHRYLDLTGPLQVGGLPRIPAHFQTSSHDFVGCISDLRIDRRFVDLNTYVADNGTAPGCLQKYLTCLSEPCFNGGTCHEGWQTHTCECPEGFAGNACQEAVMAPWRFAGNGLLSFNPLLRPIQLPWLTALSVRTWQRNAFLMQIQMGQNSSAVLALRSGRIYYAYNGEAYTLDAIDVADGRWHRIEIRWMGADISIALDYGQRVAVHSISHKVQGLYVGKIVIGSPDAGFMLSGVAAAVGSDDGDDDDDDGFAHFDGCIQDVRVGGAQSLLTKPTSREGVEDGCESMAECTDSCSSHSQCKMTWDRAACECDAGMYSSFSTSI